MEGEFPKQNDDISNSSIQLKLPAMDDRGNFEHAENDNVTRASASDGSAALKSAETNGCSDEIGSGKATAPVETQPGKLLPPAANSRSKPKKKKYLLFQIGAGNIGKGYVSSDQKQKQNSEKLEGKRLVKNNQCASLSDEFMMYRYKVVDCPHIPCNKKPEDCPYVHPSELIRRRDPRKHTYGTQYCFFFKVGKCHHDNFCDDAHGDLEVRFHPDMYRTQLCESVILCRPRFCSYAHSEEQLRIAPSQLTPPSDPAAPSQNLPLANANAPNMIEMIPNMSSSSVASPATMQNTATVLANLYGDHQFGGFNWISRQNPTNSQYGSGYVTSSFSRNPTLVPIIPQVQGLPPNNDPSQLQPEERHWLTFGLDHSRPASSAATNLRPPADFVYQGQSFTGRGTMNQHYRPQNQEPIGSGTVNQHDWPQNREPIGRGTTNQHRWLQNQEPIGRGTTNQNGTTNGRATTSDPSSVNLPENNPFDKTD